MDNYHLLARRVFTRPANFGQVICHLSCNSLYELWVNGQRVGRGPNPSFPGYLYFDSHDITALLRPGENVIAIHAYNFGPTMQSTLGQNPGPGGLIVQIENDGQLLLVTDECWRVIQDPSRKQHTYPISGHRGGFKEICDGRVTLGEWQALSFEDSGWEPAFVIGTASAEPFGFPIPSEIPPLRTATVFPVNSYFHTSGHTYGGKRNDVARPDALLVDDDNCTVIQPLSPDFAPSLLIDFGRGVYGRFEIHIQDGGDGGATIELSYGESLHLTLVDRYIVRPGAQCYTPFERRGGRYVQLTFRNCISPIRIRHVVCHEQSYPAVQQGEFVCSDAQLNQIWRVGRDTSLANMHDHFEDAPWREQTLYAGDLVNSARIAYYVWGDEALARKCLQQFARLQNEDGLIPLFGPAPKSHFVLPEYPALWITSVWNHYLHWGDHKLLAELWPFVCRCLKWYADRSDQDGLFVRRPDEPWGVFIDNLSNITATEDLAAEQMVYCQAVRHAGLMAEMLGDVARSEDLSQLAERLKSAIETRYWSDEHECLVDSRSPGHEGVTQATNGLALFLDMVRPSRRAALKEVLSCRSKAPPVRAGNLAHTMVEALVHRDQPQEALDRIREYWGGMLDRGATQYWEVFDPESPEGAMPQRLWSLSHAFCAGPAYALPAYFGGIRPLKPGFESVIIRPKLADLSWLKATVPTPRGQIQVRCHAVSGSDGSRYVECGIPENVEATVVLETRTRDIWSVWLNGQEVPIPRNGQSLSSRQSSEIHPSLLEATLSVAGIELRFGASPSKLDLHFEVRRTMGCMGRRIIVAEPGDQWDAAPKPVASGD